MEVLKEKVSSLWAAKTKDMTQEEILEGFDCLYKYTKNCKWKRGKITEIQVGKKITMCKVFEFVVGAKMLSVNVKTSNFKIVNAWIFFCWIPLDRIKLLHPTAG